MDKLIRENIERIKSLMIESDDKSEYNFCERFAGNKQKMLLCKKIGTLKSNLHKDEGIGLKKIINKSNCCWLLKKKKQHNNNERTAEQQAAAENEFFVNSSY